VQCLSQSDSFAVSLRFTRLYRFATEQAAFRRSKYTEGLSFARKKTAARASPLPPSVFAQTVNFTLERLL
jgi:hypothetical protein